MPCYPHNIYRALVPIVSLLCIRIFFSPHKYAQELVQEIKIVA
jgi:hypothetical protein